jgi:hypothetical protein
VLLITTPEEAEQRLEVRIFRVDDLVRRKGAEENLYEDADYDALIDIIAASIEHDSWMENGTGQGEISPFPPGILVISQTRRVQQQVEDFLDRLRATKAAVEADDAGSSSAATRPITRGIPLTDETALASDESRRKFEHAVTASVAWQQGDVPPEQVFLHVLPKRVIVRHTPRVVREVTEVLRDMGVSGDGRDRISRSGGGKAGNGKGGGFF